MKYIDDTIKQLTEMRDLLKRAPEGVDPKAHERCVTDVKGKGHDVGSAHAICTSSMKKGAAEDLNRQVADKKKEYADINNKMPDPMKTNTNIAAKDVKMKIKKDEGQYEGDAQYVKHHDGQWRKVLNVKDDGKPHSEGGGNWYHLEGVKDPVHQNKRGPLASGAMLNAGVKKSDCDDMKKSGYGADKETSNFLEHFNPATKHPKEPTAGMPKGTKAGEKTTSTGFKLKLVKALADAGHRESALLLKNWDEMDDIAKAFAKSNYGPKGMGLYNAGDNQRRKASNTGESHTDIGQNKNVKRYTTSASSVQAAREAKAQAEAKKNPAPVKTMKDMSPEEIKAIEMRYAKKAEDGGDSGGEGTNTDKDFRSSVVEESRCWDGYKQTPGKKPYEKGSCMKKSLDVEIERVIWDDGTVDFNFGADVPQEIEDMLVKGMEDNGYEDLSKKDWSPKKEHKSDKGGLTAKGRESYNKATGGNLKAPQPGGGKRNKSFCARNKGQIDKHNIDCKKDPKKRACLARKRWKCTN